MHVSESFRKNHATHIGSMAGGATHDSGPDPEIPDLKMRMRRLKAKSINRDSGISGTARGSDGSRHRRVVRRTA